MWGLTENSLREISFEKYEYNEKNIDKVLKEFHENRNKQVTIHFKTDLIGAPWKGDILFPNYLIDYSFE